MKVMGVTATIWPASAWIPSTRSWYCFSYFDVWASSGIRQADQHQQRQ